MGGNHSGKALFSRGREGRKASPSPGRRTRFRRPARRLGECRIAKILEAKNPGPRRRRKSLARWATSEMFRDADEGARVFLLRWGVHQHGGFRAADDAVTDAKEAWRRGRTSDPARCAWRTLGCRRRVQTRAPFVLPASVVAASAFRHGDDRLLADGNGSGSPFDQRDGAVEETTSRPNSRSPPRSPGDKDHDQ